MVTGCKRGFSEVRQRGPSGSEAPVRGHADEASALLAAGAPTPPRRLAPAEAVEEFGVDAAEAAVAEDTDYFAALGLPADMIDASAMRKRSERIEAVGTPNQPHGVRDDHARSARLNVQAREIRLNERHQAARCAKCTARIGQYAGIDGADVLHRETLPHHPNHTDTHSGAREMDTHTPAPQSACSASWSYVSARPRCRLSPCVRPCRPQ